MLRRTTLKALASVCFLGASPAVWAVTKKVRRINKDPVFFSHGVLCAKLGDGTWNLWVRAASNVKPLVSKVAVTMEVATDEGFQQIVARESLVALKERSYILRKNFKPKQTSSVLYFRFFASPVIEGLQMRSAAGPTISYYSPSGKMEPWAKLFQTIK